MKIRRNISIFFATVSIAMMLFSTVALFIADNVQQMAFASMCVPCWAVIGFIAVIDADKQDKQMRKQQNQW